MFATASFNMHDSGTHAFQKARLRARLRGCWATLTGCSRSLCTLSAATGVVSASGHFAGVQTVLVRQIGGTEGRSHDFDSDFNPLNDHTERRWLSVCNAWMRGADLPPVELIHVGATYYVRDVHHRVSVARAMGQEYIEARVTTWE
jgi:hypothetical protein